MEAPCALLHSGIELNSLWGGLARVTGVTDGRMENGEADTLLGPSLGGVRQVKAGQTVHNWVR